MEGNQTIRNHSRRYQLAEMVDPRVKPCNVVLCADEVVSYLGRKRKLEPLFEIQKVLVKCEPDGGVLPPEFVNVSQYFEPSAQKLLIDEPNFGCKRLHEIKQEFEDEVSVGLITTETHVVKQKSVPTVLQEPIPNIGTKSEVTMLSPITIKQECVSHTDPDFANSLVNGDLLIESSDVSKQIELEEATFVNLPLGNSLEICSSISKPQSSSLNVKSECVQTTHVLNENMLTSTSSQDYKGCLSEAGSSSHDADIDNSADNCVELELQQDNENSKIMIPTNIHQLKLSISFYLSTRNANNVYSTGIPLKLKYPNNHASFKQILKVHKSQDFCNKLTSSEESTFYCKLCSKTYETLPLFYKHINVVHEVEFYCCSCKTSFASLPLHISSNHEFNLSSNIFNFQVLQTMYNYACSKFYKCLLCNLVILSVEKLFFHVKNVHNICRLCSESFKAPLELITHNNTHSAGKIRYLRCNSCDLKQYNNLQHMKKHDVKNSSCDADISREIVFLLPSMMVDFRSRCPYCPLSFVKTSALFAHTLGHITKDCVSCHKRFVASEFLCNKLDLVTKCITCSMIDAENLESIGLVTSIANLSDVVIDSIKNLSRGSIAEFYINISKQSDGFKSAEHRLINLGKLENAKLKFCTLDLEFKLLGDRVLQNVRKQCERYKCFFCSIMLRAEDVYKHFGDCALLTIHCELCQWSGVSLLKFQEHLSENHDYYISSTKDFKSLFGELLFFKCYEIVVKPLSCLFCNEQFNDISRLLNHSKNFHSICRFCGIVFPNISDYLEHLQTLCHYLYQCKLCDVMFTSISLATDHCLKYHSINTNLKNVNYLFYKKCKEPAMDFCKYYNCPCCPCSFNEEQNFREHLKIHNTWKCVICKLTYILPCNDFDVNNSKCVKCQNALLSIREIDRHKTSMDFSINFKNGCKEPVISVLFIDNDESYGYKTISTFTMKSIKNAHYVLSKTKFFEKLLRCKYCESHYESSLANLCFHFVHKHEMKLVCKSCSSSSLPRVISDMTNHLTNIHEIHPAFVKNLNLYVTHILHGNYIVVDLVELSEFARKCLFCKQLFSNFSTLYDHVKIKHHYCNPCGIRLHSDKDITTHRRLHINKKIFVYKCLACDIKHRTIDAINVHYDQQHFQLSKELRNTQKYNTVVSLLKSNKNKVSSNKPLILQRNFVAKITFDCPYCISEFDIELLLCQHILKDHKVVKCESCSEDFIFSVVLDGWMHGPSVQNCYRCTL